MASIDEIVNQINAKVREHQDAAAKLAVKVAEEAQALKNKATAEVLRAGLKAAQVAADETYKTLKAQLEAEEKINQKLKIEAENARKILAELRKKLVDTDAIRDSVQSIIVNSKVLSALATNWITGMNVAGTEYIATGERVAQLVVRSDSGAIDEYKKWFQCHGSAFTAVPYQVPVTACAVISQFNEIKSKVEKAIIGALPPPFNEIYKKFEEAKARITTELKKALDKAAFEIAKQASPDKTTVDFVNLLVHPDNATAEKLNTVFRETSNSGGKALISFPNVQTMIDADLGLTGGRLDIFKFHALRYAVVLAKLSLLDRNQIKRLVTNLGGDDRKLASGVSGQRYSILFEMVRSIDGNHQWQPFGLPYPTSEGKPVHLDDPGRRHYGWGPADSDAKGTPLFIDPQLRSKVWGRLFPEPMIGAIGSHPRLNPPLYPFPTCSKVPFPVTFGSDGQPIFSGVTCE